MIQFRNEKNAPVKRSKQRQGRAVLETSAGKGRMKPTDISAPDYFHKVVDCQWACPAHTPVPEYIRLIADGRYSDAYMINWKSNVFPGILGRTCDRPCEPACRRGRVEEAAGRDLPPEARRRRLQGRHPRRLPKPGTRKNGKRIALIGGGPASLTVARDLAPLGYHCTRVRFRPEGRRHDAHARSRNSACPNS